MFCRIWCYEYNGSQTACGSVPEPITVRHAQQHQGPKILSRRVSHASLRVALSPACSICYLLQILPYLYLGGQETTSERAALDMLAVTHLLNVTKELPQHFPADFVYMQIPVADTVDESLAPHFESAHKFIDAVRTSAGKVAMVSTVAALLPRC